MLTKLRRKSEQDKATAYNTAKNYCEVGFKTIRHLTCPVLQIKLSNVRLTYMAKPCALLGTSLQYSPRQIIYRV